MAVESALVRIRTTQVERLVGEGKTPAGLVEEATDKLDAYRYASQLGTPSSPPGRGWIEHTAS